MIISKTPLRLSLIGGGTELPTWLASHEGLVIGGAINLYSYIYADKILPFHNYKSRLVYSEIETVKDNKEIRHRAINNVIKYLKMEDWPLELFHSGSIPSKSGTGSSSTFITGLIKALSSLKGDFLNNYQVAHGSISVEQDYMLEAVGEQDSVFAAFGGLNIIRFKGRHNFTVSPLLFNVQNRNIVKEFEEHLLLFYMKEERSSNEVTKGYINLLSLKEKESDMFALLALAEKSIETIYKRDYEKLGNLIDQSFRIKSKLPGVLTNRVSEIYAKARIYGAFGGKLMGAGQSGCLFLVIPPNKRQYIINEMVKEGLIHIPFQWDFSGSQVIFAN